jgi:hypothetical protein
MVKAASAAGKPKQAARLDDVVGFLPYSCA